MRSRIGIVLGLALFLAVPASLVAQEHPEHPKEHPKSSEHPAMGVSKEDLGAAVEAYVKMEMEKGGGSWKVEDEVQKTTLDLTLDKVHKDKLAMTAKDTYFACADFKGADGHAYDVDVFMQGPDKDHLKVVEVSIHKMDGKARYTWKEAAGVWKKEPA